jgi:hypothetical protein
MENIHLFIFTLWRKEVSVVCASGVKSISFPLAGDVIRFLDNMIIGIIYETEEEGEGHIWSYIFSLLPIDR